MRDLTRYPITQEEILGHLHGLKGEAMAAIGDMGPLLLAAAIDQVQENKSLHDRLNAADRANGRLVREVDAMRAQLAEAERDYAALEAKVYGPKAGQP